MSNVFCANPKMSAADLCTHVAAAESAGITTHPKAASIGFLKILQVIIAMAPFIVQYGSVVWDVVKSIFALFPNFTPAAISDLLVKWSTAVPQIQEMITLILKALGIDPSKVITPPFPPAAQ